MKIGKLNISKKNLIIIGISILAVIGVTIILTKDTKGKGVFYNQALDTKSHIKHQIRKEICIRVNRTK